MRSSWITVRAVLEAAALAGVQRDTLLRFAGLDASTQDAYGWVEHDRFDALLRGAVELSGRPSFGLHWGGFSPMIEYEFIPLLVANAATLHASLVAAQQLQSILHEEPQMVFVHEGALAKIRSTADPAHSPIARRVLGDLTMSSGKRLLDYCGRGIVGSLPHHYFAFQPGDEELTYRDFFGPNLTFDASCTEIVFPSHVLTTPNPALNAELHGMLDTQFTKLRARMSTKLSYVDQVMIELRTARPRLPPMQEVAEVLGMSVRSLRRRLDEERTTFSDVVESSRIEVARELLAKPNASVKVIAHQLGFASPSGFRIAFRRWTGESLASFRARTKH